MIEKVKEILNTSQEFLNELETHILKDILIGDNTEKKTIRQWKEYFKIVLPEDINFLTLVNVTKEIFKKYQKAAYFRDKENIEASVLEQSRNDTYRDSYKKILDKSIADFGKPLSAESCKNEAFLSVKGLEDIIATQKVIKDFWNKTCDTLTELRKLIEIMSYALSADSRVGKDFVVYESKENK